MNLRICNINEQIKSPQFGSQRCMKWSLTIYWYGQRQSDRFKNATVSRITQTTSKTAINTIIYIYSPSFWRWTGNAQSLKEHSIWYWDALRAIISYVRARIQIFRWNQILFFILGRVGNCYSKMKIPLCYSKGYSPGVYQDILKISKIFIFSLIFVCWQKNINLH